MCRKILTLCLIILYVRQATIQGFEAKGFSREEGEALLQKSVQIALEARDIYCERYSEFSSDDTAAGYGTIRNRPILVAASIGSYGAYLADGSEYRYAETCGFLELFLVPFNFEMSDTVLCYLTSCLPVGTTVKRLHCRH